MAVLGHPISYIRIRNQLTKRNMDDNKRIKAKKIKLITVFVQNTSYIVDFGTNRKRIYDFL